jgi:hypothetical protein
MLKMQLKITVEVVVNNQPLRIAAQVEGEGEAAEHAAAKLSDAIASIMFEIVSEIATTNTAQEAAAVISSTPAAEAPSSQPQSNAGVANPSNVTTTPTTMSLTSPTLLWIQRYRTHIQLSFGALLLALAMLIPIIVPTDQRREVLVMTILFGLTGALMLFTSILPGRMAKADETPRHSKIASSATPDAKLMRRREALLRAAAPRKPLKASWGIAIGVVFAIAGVFAPFLLGAVTADERFVIMLGFAPITVIGLFMIAIFGRALFRPTQPGLVRPERAAAKREGVTPVAVKRAPVARVPQNFEYRAIVPAAIVALLVLMVAVVALVVVATVASAVR